MTLIPLERTVLRYVCTQGILPAQADLPVRVDLDDLHGDLVALLDHVGHLGDTFRVELRDVNEPFGAGQDLHEGPEIDDLLYRAHVDLPALGFLGEPLHHGDGTVGGLEVGGGDEHRSVIFNVDGYSRFG